MSTVVLMHLFCTMLQRKGRRTLGLLADSAGGRRLQFIKRVGFATRSRPVPFCA